MKVELRYQGERVAIGDVENIPRRGEIVEFILVNDGLFAKGVADCVTNRFYSTLGDDPRVIIDLRDVTTMTGESIDGKALQQR